MSPRSLRKSPLAPTALTLLTVWFTLPGCGSESEGKRDAAASLEQNARYANLDAAVADVAMVHTEMDNLMAALKILLQSELSE